MPFGTLFLLFNEWCVMTQITILPTRILTLFFFFFFLPHLDLLAGLVARHGTHTMSNVPKSKKDDVISGCGVCL